MTEVKDRHETSLARHGEARAPSSSQLRRISRERSPAPGPDERADRTVGTPETAAVLLSLDEIDEKIAAGIKMAHQQRVFDLQGSRPARFVTPPNNPQLMTRTMGTAES
ncbi:hypothetical protein PC120_g26524 [Phytophthora cactorum]|nr:hypothetical protein PC120_g26524 [Phytophthora cactorum]